MNGLHAPQHADRAPELGQEDILLEGLVLIVTQILRAARVRFMSMISTTCVLQDLPIQLKDHGKIGQIGLAVL